MPRVPSFDEIPSWSFLSKEQNPHLYLRSRLRKKSFLELQSHCSYNLKETHCIYTTSRINTQSSKDLIKRLDLALQAQARSSVRVSSTSIKFSHQPVFQKHITIPMPHHKRSTPQLNSSKCIPVKYFHRCYFRFVFLF